MIFQLPRHDYPAGLKKLEDDLRRLDHFNTIISIEIDLQQNTILSNDLHDFCSVHEGIFHLSGSIFIDYNLIDNFILYQLLYLLFFQQDIPEDLDSIIVQLQTPLRDFDLIYTVGITLETDMPMIFSIERKYDYSQFLHLFQFLWKQT